MQIRFSNLKRTSFCEYKFSWILRILAKLAKLDTHEINFKNSKFYRIFYAYL